ncbi:MAG TPA: sugar ABC transporter substrate-binding protein [Ktedonobacteraceae bacterium]|nr:sugar ABC transporter substrate-binding protein [Ktedonobacteraceae bacterium]
MSWLHGMLARSGEARSKHTASNNLLRGLSMFCALFVVWGIVAACGSSSSATTSNGKTVITVLDHWPTEPSNTEVNKLFKQYEQLHPNITIERNAVPVGNLVAKADQEAASHTLPSILMLDNPDMASFASTGVLSPLNSFMQGKYNTSDFYGGSLSTMTYNGKIYGFSVGNNDLALYYNKKLFTAAGLTPPATWADLQADAKKLTSGNTYGLALSAAATEEGTWQFLPFFWSNKGDLKHVNNAQGVQALQLITNMMKEGSISKSALNWGQPDVLTQFEEGHAAMMVNGPWDLSVLDGLKTIDYGVVPVPVPQAGDKAISPLGGEDWTIPVADPAKEQAAWNLLDWLEQPAQITQFDQINGYTPPLKSEGAAMVKADPELQVFATELNSAEARTAEVGASYPTISQAMWTAEQSALTGSQSPQAALSTAQQKVDTTLQSQS